MQLQHVDLPIETGLPLPALCQAVRNLAGRPGIARAEYDRHRAHVVLEYDETRITLAHIQGLLGEEGIIPMREWLRRLLRSVLRTGGDGAAHRN